MRRAIDLNEQSLAIAKEVGDRVGEAKALYRLGCSFESQGSLQKARDCFQSSVRSFSFVRNRLQFHDEWKISLSDLYRDTCNSLGCLELKLGKVLEALSCAERERAKALKDLMEFNYGFEGQKDESSTVEETSVDDIMTFSSFPLNTVFMAVIGEEIIFWHIKKGNVVLRRKNIRDNSSRDATTFLTSLMQLSYEEIGVRSGMICEDRSLDKLRDDRPGDQGSEQARSHPLHLQKDALKTLYDVIIGPIADSTDGNEIIFVPHGPLCLAPYAAFIDTKAKYLCESFRIRVIPSLTSLNLIADCPAGYHSNTGTLLVGDPWVQEVNYQGKKLQQLPYAREEVEMIGRILNTAPLTGTEARKDKVLERLSSVALVHIAAHGRMATGEIALAPNPTRESQNPAEKDFLLTIKDVLSVQVRAKLVVLSCCHSGRGEINVEGVVGIARAFMGAGARSVLVSLWAIDDEATMEFMKSFYQQLAQKRSASEALNQAMNHMRRSDKFSEVKYWAPFVLIGDDVTLAFDERQLKCTK